VYRYLFSRAPVAARGAFHGIELAYVFQKLAALTATPSAADLAVEASLLTVWTRFASTGRLDAVTTVGWPPYAAGEPLLRLDATQEALSGWRGAECDFWDGFVGVSVPAP
jgi:carboxylesterase type B